MCTGRIDLSFVIRALAGGADGVLVGGCWPGECHYVTEGNYDALANLHLGRKLLEHVGLRPERLRLEWIAASEGTRFAEIMSDYVGQLEELGPLGEPEGLDTDTMKEGLESIGKMVPQLKLLAREKLQVKVKSEEAYNTLFASEKVKTLLDDFLADPDSVTDELPAYYIDPEKCVACLICFKRCPVKGIDGAKKTIHIIDQEACTRCGTCYHVCPPRIGAVRKVTDEPVPPPIPDVERTIVKPKGAKQA